MDAYGVRMYTIAIPPVSFITHRGKENEKTVTKRMPPSLNVRGHWAVRKKWCDAFQKNLIEAIKHLKIPPLKKCQITVVNHGVREVDIDNAYSLCKPLFDAVVKAGVIPDDKSKYADLRYEFWRVHHLKDEYLTVEILVI